MSEKDLVDAIKRIADRLESPNVMDNNLEASNIVDVIHECSQAGFEIARSLRAIAEALGGPM